MGAYYFKKDSGQGRAYLYHGSATGLSTTAAWTGEASNQTGSQYGKSVSSAGDVNGDRYSDVLVGACFYSNGDSDEDEGRAYLYLGSNRIPVTIFPGSGNLPAPTVTVANRSATISASMVTVQLPTRARNAAIKKLMESGISRLQAIRALSKLQVTYIFSVTQGGRTTGVGSSDVEIQRASITHRSRSNQITLNKLPAGVKSVSYRVEIATRKPPLVLGSTKPSAKTGFAVPRS